MEYRHLGKSGLEVSALCLGCMNLGRGNEKESARTMNAALDAPHLAAGAPGKMGKNTEQALPAIRGAWKHRDEPGRKRFLEVTEEIEKGQDTTQAARAHREIIAQIARFRKTLVKNLAEQRPMKCRFLPKLSVRPP